MLHKYSAGGPKVYQVHTVGKALLHALDLISSRYLSPIKRKSDGHYQHLEDQGSKSPTKGSKETCTMQTASEDVHAERGACSVRDDDRLNLKA